MVLALGGATGPAMNPARDLGPRLAFHILPIPGKVGSCCPAHLRARLPRSWAQPARPPWKACRLSL
jgi:hypothetical protein